MVECRSSDEGYEGFFPLLSRSPNGVCFSEEELRQLGRSKSRRAFEDSWRSGTEKHHETRASVHVVLQNDQGNEQADF